MADNKMEWTLAAAAATTSATAPADHTTTKPQKQEIEKELARVLRYCRFLSFRCLVFDNIHQTCFSRESDASKKNEPVIDWLDANVGRVSCSFY